MDIVIVVMHFNIPVALNWIFFPLYGLPLNFQGVIACAGTCTVGEMNPLLDLSVHLSAFPSWHVSNQERRLKASCERSKDRARCLLC